MGKYAVTQALWQSVMGSNPSHFKGANRPVEQVSWFDCVAFCNKLSEQEGLTPAYAINGQDVSCDWTANRYRLPTEAEWEYSARGGEYKYAGSDNVDGVAWYDGNSGGQTHQVGQEEQWFWTLRHGGNVNEWCWDWELGGGDYSNASQQEAVKKSNWRILLVTTAWAVVATEPQPEEFVRRSITVIAGRPVHSTSVSASVDSSNLLQSRIDEIARIQASPSKSRNRLLNQRHNVIRWIDLFEE